MAYTSQVKMRSAVSGQVKKGTGLAGNARVGAPSGEDGFSPIAQVVQTENGAEISITDKAGTTTATITNGRDGREGKDGQNGYTPVKGVDYDDGKDGKDGYSVYYLRTDAEISDANFWAVKMYLSEDGIGVKTGDHLISRNGILCKVTDVTNDKVSYKPIVDISGAKGDKGDKGDPYTLTPEDKSEMVSAVIASLPIYNGEVVAV